MKIVSFFSGAGGLDLGFEQVGFEVIWANEYDSKIWETYQKNHKNTFLDKRSIIEIKSDEIPDCDGIIGGPPCQSWSEAGSLKGINDKRGQLFFEFIRIIADKQPKFFLAENVSGMLMQSHSLALKNIKELFIDCGYELSFAMLNASQYGIPQDRKRIFFIGYRKDLQKNFVFPMPITPTNKVTLRDTIFDLKDSAVSESIKIGQNIPNHEYMNGGFSSIYMSRNRVRSWDEVSFTIQAMGRHAPIHPQAPKMNFVEVDRFEFARGYEDLYRRLSVRECARIQTFPDDFIFYYKNIADGYKMIGNAVPVKLAKVLANCIKTDLEDSHLEDKNYSSKLTHKDINKRMLELIDTNMAKQSQNGKAFEYALLKEFKNRLSLLTTVVIFENKPYATARECFEMCSIKEQEEYSLNSSAAVNFLIDLEPRLSHGINESDILQLEIAPDSNGQRGDVRDLLIIRSLHKWEIGISAKNNHAAVKHSRLSMSIDFGMEWLGIPCSENYFKEIHHIFSILTEIRKVNRKASWKTIPDMHKTIYVPILEAFKKELIKLDNENPNTVPEKLSSYLIGRYDFYKIIKRKHKIEVQAYNLHGTLNQPLNEFRPKARIQRLKLPSRLIEVTFKKNSSTTLLITLDEGWQISFRIHNAEKYVIPSLKFDIKLISTPYSLFNNHIINR